MTVTCLALETSYFLCPIQKGYLLIWFQFNDTMTLGSFAS